MQNHSGKLVEITLADGVPHFKFHLIDPDPGWYGIILADLARQFAAAFADAVSKGHIKMVISPPNSRAAEEDFIFRCRAMFNAELDTPRKFERGTLS